jgi:transcriptional regulator with XRE-family HTH domain
MGCTSKYISKVENGASAPSLPFVIKFSEITGSDLNYLLRGMYPKGESTAMLVREPASIYELSAGLSKKSRKICSEVMTKIIEVLEENKI